MKIHLNRTGPNWDSFTRSVWQNPPALHMDDKVFAYYAFCTCTWITILQPYRTVPYGNSKVKTRVNFKLCLPDRAIYNFFSECTPQLRSSNMKFARLATKWVQNLRRHRHRCVQTREAKIEPTPSGVLDSSRKHIQLCHIVRKSSYHIPRPMVRSKPLFFPA